MLPGKLHLMSVTELINQALELPIQDRAELISAVFDSIDNFEDTNENDLYNEALSAIRILNRVLLDR